MLGLEITRLYFNAAIRNAVLIFFIVAGLFAHISYLSIRVSEGIQTGTLLNNWELWCLVVALLMVCFYIWFFWRQPKTIAGIIFLPFVLLLTTAAWMLQDSGSFAVGESKSFWGTLHGCSLLLGTAVVFIGFVSGGMYLFQSRRLKQKKTSGRFRLPSLEWLQRLSERALILSTVLLGFGVLSGIVLNLANQGKRATTIEWSDPVVWSSTLLFGWLATVLVFNWIYKPARQGRKVAYLVVTSFLFLLIELAIVFSVQHAAKDSVTWKSHKSQRDHNSIVLEVRR